MATAAPSGSAELRRRITRMIQYYTPDRVAETDQLLAKYRGHEQKMLDAYLAKYGPEPPSSVSTDMPPAPSSDAAAVAAGAAAGGNTDKPPIPEAVINAYLLKASEDELRSMITDIVTAHMPTKKPDAVLREFQGKEKALLRGLLKKTKLSDELTARVTQAVPPVPKWQAAVALPPIMQQLQEGQRQPVDVDKLTDAEVRSELANIVATHMKGKPLDKVLEECKGKERQLLQALIRRFSGMTPSPASARGSIGTTAGSPLTSATDPPLASDPTVAGAAGPSAAVATAAPSTTHSSAASSIPSPPPLDAATSAEFESRILAMIARYAPEKMSEAHNVILPKYRHNLPALLTAYVTKYGPEPSPASTKGVGHMMGSSEASNADNSTATTAPSGPRAAGAEPLGTAPSGITPSAVAVNALTTDDVPAPQGPSAASVSTSRRGSLSMALPNIATEGANFNPTSQSTSGNRQEPSGGQQVADASSREREPVISGTVAKVRELIFHGEPDASQAAQSWSQMSAFLDRFPHRVDDVYQELQQKYQSQQPRTNVVVVGRQETSLHDRTGLQQGDETSVSMSPPPHTFAESEVAPRVPLTDQGSKKSNSTNSVAEVYLPPSEERRAMLSAGRMVSDDVVSTKGQANDQLDAPWARLERLVLRHDPQQLARCQEFAREHPEDVPYLLDKLSQRWGETTSPAVATAALVAAPSDVMSDIRRLLTKHDPGSLDQFMEYVALRPEKAAALRDRLRQRFADDDRPSSSTPVEAAASLPGTAPTITSSQPFAQSEKSIPPAVRGGTPAFPVPPSQQVVAPQENPQQQQTSAWRVIADIAQLVYQHDPTRLAYYIDFAGLHPTRAPELLLRLQVKWASNARNSAGSVPRTENPVAQVTRLVETYDPQQAKQYLEYLSGHLPEAPQLLRRLQHRWTVPIVSQLQVPKVLKRAQHPDLTRLPVTLEGYYCHADVCAVLPIRKLCFNKEDYRPRVLVIHPTVFALCDVPMKVGTDARGRTRSGFFQSLMSSSPPIKSPTTRTTENPPTAPPNVRQCMLIENFSHVSMASKSGLICLHTFDTSDEGAAQGVGREETSAARQPSARDVGAEEGRRQRRLRAPTVMGDPRDRSASAVGGGTGSSPPAAGRTKSFSIFGGAGGDDDGDEDARNGAERQQALDYVTKTDVLASSKATSDIVFQIDEPDEAARSLKTLELLRCLRYCYQRHRYFEELYRIQQTAVVDNAKRNTGEAAGRGRPSLPTLPTLLVHDVYKTTVVENAVLPASSDKMYVPLPMLLASLSKDDIGQCVQPEAAADAAVVRSPITQQAATITVDRSLVGPPAAAPVAPGVVTPLVTPEKAVRDVAPAVSLEVPPPREAASPPEPASRAVLPLTHPPFERVADSFAPVAGVAAAVPRGAVPVVMPPALQRSAVEVETATVGVSKTSMSASELFDGWLEPRHQPNGAALVASPTPPVNATPPVAAISVSRHGTSTSQATWLGVGHRAPQAVSMHPSAAAAGAAAAVIPPCGTDKVRAAFQRIRLGHTADGTRSFVDPPPVDDPGRAIAPAAMHHPVSMSLPSAPVPPASLWPERPAALSPPRRAFGVGDSSSSFAATALALPSADRQLQSAAIAERVVRLPPGAIGAGSAVWGTPRATLSSAAFVFRRADNDHQRQPPSSMAMRQEMSLDTRDTNIECATQPLAEPWIPDVGNLTSIVASAVKRLSRTPSSLNLVAARDSSMPLRFWVDLLCFADALVSVGAVDSGGRRIGGGVAGFVSRVAGGSTWARAVEAAPWIQLDVPMAGVEGYIAEAEQRRCHDALSHHHVDKLQPWSAAGSALYVRRTSPGPGNDQAFARTDVATQQAAFLRSVGDVLTVSVAVHGDRSNCSPQAATFWARRRWAWPFDVVSVASGGMTESGLLLELPEGVLYAFVDHWQRQQHAFLVWAVTAHVKPSTANHYKAVRGTTEAIVEKARREVCPAVVSQRVADYLARMCARYDVAGPHARFRPKTVPRSDDVRVAVAIASAPCDHFASRLGLVEPQEDQLNVVMWEKVYELPTVVWEDVVHRACASSST